MQEKGDTALLSDIEQQQEKTAKQLSRITGTGMRREALFGGGMMRSGPGQSAPVIATVSLVHAPHQAATTTCCAGDESWLKEQDLDFFARGPAETADAGQAADGSGAVVVVSFCIQADMPIPVCGLVGRGICLVAEATFDRLRLDGSSSGFCAYPYCRSQTETTKASVLLSDTPLPYQGKLSMSH